jgi:hypothetical protein
MFSTLTELLRPPLVPETPGSQHRSASGRDEAFCSFRLYQNGRKGQMAYPRVPARGSTARETAQDAAEPLRLTSPVLAEPDWNFLPRLHLEQAQDFATVCSESLVNSRGGKHTIT